MTEQIELTETKEMVKPKVAMTKIKGNPTDEQIMLAAVETGNIDVLERLVALKERGEARVAEKLFNEAFAAVQAQMSGVVANKENKQTNSRYGTIEDINAMLMPIIGANGFSISFYQTKSELEKCIRIAGDLSHVAGHTRNYWIDLPVDNAGIKGTVNKTPMHAVGSTFTYGQRYLVKLIFNVSIVGEDDDGNAAGNNVETITPAQEKILTNLIGVKDVDLPLLQKILGFYKIDSLASLPANLFKQCQNKIVASKKAAANDNS